MRCQARERARRRRERRERKKEPLVFNLCQTAPVSEPCLKRGGCDKWRHDTHRHQRTSLGTRETSLLSLRMFHSNAHKRSAIMQIRRRVTRRARANASTVRKHRVADSEVPAHTISRSNLFVPSQHLHQLTVLASHDSTSDLSFNNEWQRL